VSDQDVAGESTRARKTPNLRESRRALDFQSRFAPADRATRTALRVPCLYEKRRHRVSVRRVAPSSDGSAAPSDKADALVPAPAESFYKLEFHHASPQLRA
jgi:hypothetical protein